MTAAFLFDKSRSCDCGPNCDDTCRGECGCVTCQDAYGELIAKYEPKECPRCNKPFDPPGVCPSGRGCSWNESPEGKRYLAYLLNQVPTK